jgi:multiple sugar transport system substrate-binding protein
MLGGFAVGAGAVLAAACGGGTTAMTDEMPKEEKAEMKAEEKAPVAEEVSILYLTYVRPARNEAEAALYGAFEEANPGITLDLKIIDGGGQGVRQNIPILFAAGTPVGLFENTWGTWLQFVEGDLIVPLGPLMARDGVNPYETFIAEGVDFVSHRGETYGFPASMSVDSYAYNKNLFDEAGLAYPPLDPADASWTMERFIDTAEKLTKGTEQFGMRRGYTGFNTFGIGDGTFFGGLAWDAENQKATMNNQHYVQGINFWIDIVDKFHVMPTSEEHSAIVGGRTGHPFYTTGAFGMSVMFVVPPESQEAPFDWGIGALPYTGEPPSHSGRHYTHATFVGNTDHVDQTWEVLKWLLDGDNGLTYLELTGHVVTPMLHLFDQAKAHWEEKQGGNVDGTAYFLEAQHTPQSGHGMLKYSNFYEIRDILQPIYNDVRARKATIEEFLPFADTHINENLKVE